MKKHLFKHCLLPLALPLLWMGCIQEDYEGPDPESPSRTVLVYIAGDNNLSELGSAVEEIRQAWTYTGNHCIVYYDAADASPVLLSLRGGCQVTPVPYVETIAEYPEENSASAEVFGRVLGDVVRMYPADSYGLVYASHATGWLPEGMLQDPDRTTVSRSLGKDYHTGTLANGSSEMELCDFAAVIPDGQFEFIIFEACLMAGVEVVYELRDKTRYILASSAELLSAGFIPVYREAFGCLMDTHSSTEECLINLAQDYQNYINTQNGSYRSMTLSIIKTERLNVLATLVEKILSRPISSSFSLADMQRFDRPGCYGDYPMSPRYFDLEEYLELASSSLDYNELVKEMKEIVLWKAASPAFMAGSRGGFTIDRHCGLTTYIEQDIFPELNTAYHTIAWYRATHSGDEPI